MQLVLGRLHVVDKEAVKLIRRLTKELLGYLNYNRDSLPNYGQRYRAGKRISSAFIESAVNQLIDKRMSKSQQMRWDPRSAHLLLQVRGANIRSNKQQLNVDKLEVGIVCNLKPKNRRN